MRRRRPELDELSEVLNLVRVQVVVGMEERLNHAHTHKDVESKDVERRQGR